MIHHNGVVDNLFTEPDPITRGIRAYKHDMRWKFVFHNPSPAAFGQSQTTPVAVELLNEATLVSKVFRGGTEFQLDGRTMALMPRQTLAAHITDQLMESIGYQVVPKFIGSTILNSMSPPNGGGLILREKPDRLEAPLLCLNSKYLITGLTENTLNVLGSSPMHTHRFQCPAEFCSYHLSKFPENFSPKLDDLLDYYPGDSSFSAHSNIFAVNMRLGSQSFISTLRLLCMPLPESMSFEVVLGEVFSNLFIRPYAVEGGQMNPEMPSFLFFYMFVYRLEPEFNSDFPMRNVLVFALPYTRNDAPPSVIERRLEDVDWIKSVTYHKSRQELLNYYATRPSSNNVGSLYNSQLMVDLFIQMFRLTNNLSSLTSKYNTQPYDLYNSSGGWSGKLGEFLGITDAKLADYHKFQGAIRKASLTRQDLLKFLSDL